MKHKTASKSPGARGERAKARSQQRVVRPPFRVGQIVRHRLTGELMIVAEVIVDMVKLRPQISEITVSKWGYEHWEAV